MKDNELRGLILQEYYNRRRKPVNMLKEDDFQPPINKEDILYISEQLAQHGLIEWRPIKNGPKLVEGSGRITAPGIDIIENKGIKPPIQILIPQNININNSTGVQVGNNNTQNKNININENSQLFIDIESALKEEIENAEERNIILSKLDKVRSSLGSPSCLDAYKEFMGIAANHMTVLAPFLPALAQLIS
jgi:hypothetical protein